MADDPAYPTNPDKWDNSIKHGSVEHGVLQGEIRAQLDIFLQSRGAGREQTNWPMLLLKTCLWKSG